MSRMDPVPLEAAVEAVGRDLVEFWNWASQRGEVNGHTAAGLRSATKEVLSTVEPDGWAAMDLRVIDVENTCQRFVRLKAGSNFKPDSLSRYQARFRRGLSSYLEYLDAPDRWRFETDRPERANNDGPADVRPRKNAAANRPKVKDVTPPTPPLGQSVVRMIDYTFPLRPSTGVDAKVHLPVDLTRIEAKRLADFISALATDPQLALPAAGGTHEA